MDIIIQHKNATNDENTVYDYTSMPPPPYSTSTSSNGGAAATHIKTMSPAFFRLKSMSGLYTTKKKLGISSAMRQRNIATTTDSYTENTKPSIYDTNASSSSPFIEQNKSTSESSTMNDSLERISTSLQLLIEEAQASLLTTSTQPSQQQEAETLVDYSYRYVQQGYLQSQEKLALAIDKLEQKTIIPQLIIITIMQQQHIPLHQHQYHPHHSQHQHPPRLIAASYGSWAWFSYSLAIQYSLVTKSSMPKPAFFCCC
ncbi:hypothetical protein MAM1_0055d03560 [Mucor ambiguus]|uniref:Uncharacterized protein n=1 Tax=Mucor ambiguus TaxID=91626 RepID=A0A0C9M4D3_9FUNG|nr:hypothetical protein MAM1_0055d03560 [Mucor ambiguus]